MRGFRILFRKIDTALPPPHIPTKNDSENSNMSPIRFAIIGSGWRSEFFLRIASALPKQFSVSGLVTRSPETAKDITSKWGIPCHPDIESLLSHGPHEFVVVSVPGEAAPKIAVQLVEKGIPVLCETPPAVDLESLIELYERVGKSGLIQVAEQYHLSPLTNAQLRAAGSGIIGQVSQAMVAQCHNYHGVSLLRRALGIGADPVTVTASVFRYPLVAGPDRDGDPQMEKVVTANQTTARFDFGNKLGVYDFAPEQYFSWIRGNRVLIRGDRGEIENTDVRYIKDFCTPVTSSFRRIATGQNGNLEGMFLRGIQLGEEWLFSNPFMPSRLNDDEIAIARMLMGMSERCAGGPDVYSLAEASHDQYLSLLMEQATATGVPTRSRTQIWSDKVSIPAQAKPPAN